MQVPLSLPHVTNLLTEHFSQCPQRSPRTQLSCLAPRASSIQAQGFSDEVARRIEAPHRCSTRAVYEVGHETNKLDFRSPSLSQLTDFLLHLFQEKHLQPSTIDGYRTAIADKIGNDRFNISRDENLTCLLESFHRDKPKFIEVSLVGTSPWP